jgi:hypothetical protein
MKFNGMIYTDGVGVSVLKQNFDPGTRRGGGGKKRSKHMMIILSRIPKV